MVKIDNHTVESAGHSIKAGYTRKGFGNLLLELLVIEAKKMKFQRFIGWISEYNVGSIKNFEHSGCERSYTPFKLVKLEALGREDRFYMYERTL